MDSKKTEFIIITAKNSETVEFRKFNSIEGNVAVYDENGSFSKQLSTNCGVFVFNIKENENASEIVAGKKLLVIVTPQYGVDFLKNHDNSLNTDVEEKNNLNKLLFSNKDKGLFFKGDEKSKIKLTLSKIPADKIKEINKLIKTFNQFAECTLTELPEVNDENKDKPITITITPFAFDVAGLFEDIAREKIREIINKNKPIAQDWEVLDGNKVPHCVLRIKTKMKLKAKPQKIIKVKLKAKPEKRRKAKPEKKSLLKDKFHINGTVKPDIIIYNKKTDKYIIIDAKYKSPDKNDRDDRLQILAYAYLYDAHIVGHIFPAPAKSSGRKNNSKLESHKLNTSLGKYDYVQLYLDDENLSDNIKEIIKGNNQKTEEICDKENEQYGNQ